MRFINANRDAGRKVNRVKNSVWDRYKGEKGKGLEQNEQRLGEENRRIKDERRDAHRAAGTIKTRKLKLELKLNSS